MTRPERFRKLKEVLSRRQPDLTVLMEGVHKPHNFAAILRSCDAVGALEAHAVRPAGEVELPNLTSGGTARWIRVHVHDGLDGALDALRDDGFRVVAADPAAGASDFRAVDYTRATAFLLGTELHGLTDEAVDAADEVVAIPLEGFVASLNVSVAAALLLFEARRQRDEAGSYDRRRLDEGRFHRILFEWAYPRIAERCREEGVPYPELGPDGEILGDVPR